MGSGDGLGSRLGTALQMWGPQDPIICDLLVFPLWGHRDTMCSQRTCPSQMSVSCSPVYARKWMCTWRLAVRGHADRTVLLAVLRGCPVCLWSGQPSTQSCGHGCSPCTGTELTQMTLHSPTALHRQSGICPAVLGSLGLGWEVPPVA